VENEAQAAFLKNEGCDLAQGYLYSRPVSSAEFEKLFAAR
jgi:EAL domain-containing protein (putative c-di-GMP-specific phosphodiesterase class I)